jgi:hypothetical protein
MEQVPPARPAVQYLRAYTLGHEAPEPVPLDGGADGSDQHSFMGARTAGLVSPDGRRLDSLYVPTVEDPFVHVLDLAGRTMARLPLVGTRKTYGEADLLWSLALDAGTGALLGQVAGVDRPWGLLRVEPHG